MSKIDTKETKTKLKTRIWEMGRNWSPWVKFDHLTTKIFWFYNFGSLDAIKFNVFLKSQHQYDVRVTPRSKESLDFLSQQFKFYNKKNWAKKKFVSLISTFDIVSCIFVFKLGQSVTDRNPDAVNTTKESSEQHNHTIESFDSFDLSLSYHTHSWLVNTYHSY